MAYQILVVDDEKLIVKGIKFSLEQDGMEVTAAYDGEEALQNIKEKNFDLVVLDVMLPKMDGLEVCQQTREFSQVPIIMVTAKGEDMDKIMGLEYGADDYITKPFNILELKARIKAILRRSVKKAPAETQEKKSSEGKRPRAFLRQQTCIYQRKGGKPDREGIRPSGAAHGKPRKGLQQRKTSGYRLGL